MNEYPILFSGEMVKMISDGRKTQTRRVMKPQPWGYDPSLNQDGLWEFCDDEERNEKYHVFKCPYGKPGDLLWIREAWAHGELYCDEGPNCGLPSHIYYRQIEEENGTFGGVKHWSWRPSVHMPRWASRITLEVTNVRVERVQDITWHDIAAEGCPPEHHMDNCNGISHAMFGWFGYLWDSINAKRGYGWDVNPWVWVVEFKAV